MKQLVLCAALSFVFFCCGDNLSATDGDEDCTLAGDEDGNGKSDCADPACAPSLRCQAICGNGRGDSGEACDDGNRNNDDGCDSNCTISACGNGVKNKGEACDDGNSNNGDRCDNNCTVTACGNGIVTTGTGEVCDDGNVVDSDGCDSNCTITGCGNGIPTSGEGCDDGNATNGDGCDSNCTVTACGNGIVASGEECDDGNSTPFDGCSADCTLEPLEQEPNEDGTPSVGGTDINGNDFDTTYPDMNGAFTRSTTIRAAISPLGDEDVFLLRNTSTSSQVVRLDVWNPTLGIGVPCGASIDTALHVRDAAGISLASNNDRNGVADRCSTLELLLQPSASIYAHVIDLGDDSEIPGYVLDMSFRDVVCGDGAIGPSEQCDDGNTTNGDGCSAVCQLEIGMEVEPNNTLPEATGNVVQITGDTTIQGAITPVADVDTYRVTVTTPTVVRFETFSSLYQCTAMTTVDLRLLDSAGAPILIDTAGVGIGPCGAISVFLDAGTYFIRAEERGNNATLVAYLLQVDYQTDRGSEAEPPMSTGFNDTIETTDRALQGGDNVFVLGSHLDPEDIDVYAITVPGGARIRAEAIEGDRAAETCESNGVDTRLTLFNQAGTQVADDDDDGRGFCSLLDGRGTTPLDAGARNNSAVSQIFYLMVRRSDFATGGRQTFLYRVQITFH